MRSIHNAVLDTVEELRLVESGVDYSITNDRNNSERWIVRFKSKHGSLVFFLFEIEIMENEGNPSAALMEECAEVIQIIAKYQRFGGDWNEIPPNKEKTRWEMLKEEMEDVLFQWERLKTERGLK